MSAKRPPDDFHEDAKIPPGSHWATFSESSFATMECALNRATPDKELRDELSLLLPIFLEQRLQSGVDLNKKRRALEAVERAANILVGKLTDDELISNGQSPHVEWQQVQWQGDDSDDLIDFEGAASRVAWLSKSVAKLLDKIGRQKTPGRPADDRRNQLVRTLSDVEEKYTGRRSKVTCDVDTGEYRGPLFTLVKTFEKGIAQKFKAPPRLDADIAQLIRRSRK
jgi:hypothetical protein